MRAWLTKPTSEDTGPAPENVEPAKKRARTESSAAGASFFGRQTTPAAIRKAKRLISWNIEGAMKGKGGASYSAAFAGAGRDDVVSSFAAFNDDADLGAVDIVCLQEVWMRPAHPSPGAGQGRLGSDGKTSTKTTRRDAVNRTLREAFPDFVAVWSLHSEKSAAGTGVLLRKGVRVHSKRFDLRALREWAESDGTAAAPKPARHHAGVF